LIQVQAKPYFSTTNKILFTKYEKKKLSHVAVLTIIQFVTADTTIQLSPFNYLHHMITEQYISSKPTVITSHNVLKTIGSW